MATKTIKAWVDGAVQEIEVTTISSDPQPTSYDERLDALESRVPTISTITLLASDWSGADNLYSQIVTIDGITATSMIDLQPTPEQMIVWQDEGWSFTTLNDDGVVNVYVSGGKPTEDVTVQVKIQEVTVV